MFIKMVFENNFAVNVYIFFFTIRVKNGLKYYSCCKIYKFSFYKENIYYGYYFESDFFLLRNFILFLVFTIIE